MRKVKNKMIKQLFTMLHECNLSDYSNDEELRNDLPATCSHQDKTYGHIGEAIKSLGYEGEYQLYIQTGDRPEDFTMNEETVRAVFESDMFDNDIHDKIEYINDRNPKYTVKILLEMYDNL